jgi:hypothetical protein
MMCVMKRHLLPALAPILALCPPGGRAQDDAAANKRPPMTRAALERHWGVDCTRLAATLSDWSEHGDGAAQPSWREQSRLCAAIHAPPGETGVAPCPDYARIRDLLAAGAARSLVRKQLQCAP